MAIDDAIFERERISSAYQPIVDLATGEVVAVEALARWPSLGVAPDRAFAHARRAGRSAELDQLCQRAAVEGLRGAGLSSEIKVFVNVEPTTPVTVLAERSTGPRLVAEITERAMLDDPAGLLRSVRTLRQRGCGIALDDVGAVPDSLALLPFVDPDVIKLDLSLVQGWPDVDQARILTAVAAHAERTGATVLAEGIETAAHRDQAVALGATLGQGWYFARPGPLAAHPRPSRTIPLLTPAATTATTPFELVDPRRLRVGTKGMLLAISRHIEQQGMTLDTPPVVISAFQDAPRYTAQTAERYRHLAQRCPLVVALGTGMPATPSPGVRGADIPAGHPLHGEWTVVIVGTHYTGALIARDLGDGGPDLQRRFLFALTHHPATVAAAARALLAHTAGPEPDGDDGRR